MAKFKCSKFPSFFVVGGGRFESGSLEVEGEKAEKVRHLVGDDRFGITEEGEPEAEVKAAPKHGRPRKSE